MINIDKRCLNEKELSEVRNGLARNHFLLSRCSVWWPRGIRHTSQTTESSHGHRRSNSSYLSSFCTLFEHRHPYFSPSAEMHHTSNILFLRFILHQDTSRQVSLFGRKAACWPLWHRPSEHPGNIAQGWLGTRWIPLVRMMSPFVEVMKSKHIAGI